MKDYDLTKLDAFEVNRELWSLKNGLKSVQTSFSVILMSKQVFHERHFPNSRFVTVFYSFANCKMYFNFAEKNHRQIYGN